jgi:hypothetical protein
MTMMTKDTSKGIDMVPAPLPAEDTPALVHSPRDDATADYEMDIQSPMLMRLYELWRHRHADGKLPARGDFDPVEMKECLGNIFLLEYLPDIDNFRYTLIGTKIAGWVGVDNTGKLVDEVFDERVRLFYKGLQAREVPARTIGKVVWRDKQHVAYEAIMLPLSDDKRTVNRFIGAMEFYMKC